MSRKLQVGDRVKIKSAYPFELVGKYGKIVRKAGQEFHRGTTYDLWIVEVWFGGGKSEEHEFADDVLERQKEIE